MRSKHLGKLRPLHDKSITIYAGSKRKLIPFLDKKLEFVLVDIKDAGHELNDDFETIIGNFLKCPSNTKDIVAQHLYEYFPNTEIDLEKKPSSAEGIWEHIRMWNITIGRLEDANFYACIMCGFKHSEEETLQINFKNGTEFIGICDQEAWFF